MQRGQWGNYVGGCVARDARRAQYSNQNRPRPQRTYLFKDLYKEIIIRSPKQVGSLGSREVL